jgi:hypothetical protein
MPCLAATGDIDTNGFVDYFDICLSISGPNDPPIFNDCILAFDFDDDQDVDLQDYAGFQLGRGHVPIPLRDTLGNVITADATIPYSGRQTCGGTGGGPACHDIDYIANGSKFQQGRTDLDGNVIMQDDFFGDGRWWIRSPAKYGRAVPVGHVWTLAGKQNANESAIDYTTFGWVAECGGCHTGGGPGEYDRDDVLLYNQTTGEFGWEVLGMTPAEALLDGDYGNMDGSGNLSLAPWDATGLSEPDCLFCHTPNPAWADGAPLNREVWRSATMKARADLVDDQGIPVPAFAAGGPAAQGWFSNLETNPEGVATVLQVDYSVGVNAGTLQQDPGDTLHLPATSVDGTPRDKVCWPCHMVAGFIRGQVWFDERSVHYSKFNNLSDEDPSNDIPPHESRTCVYCHPGNLEHVVAKGNFPDQVYRDEMDYVNMRTCRECHLTEIAPGVPNPEKHPEAPDVPGALVIHSIPGMNETLSCEACHVPYPLLSPAWAVLEIATAGTLATDGVYNIYMTDMFYSADPLNPSDPDKSRWYMGFEPKVDSDGATRLFPEMLFHYYYWADWDQNETPADMSDDAVVPIALWRVREITGGEPLPVATDDNGDGKKEVNRPEEILAYIQALKGNDSYGRPVAEKPVLVKGYRIWYEDPQAPDGVSSFDPNDAGIKVEYGGKKGNSHNVLAATEAWGAGGDCDSCHRDDGQSPVFDRLILFDPFGTDGQPVYRKVRELTGVEPFHGEDVVLKDSLGNPITIASTEPYSGRQTCGGVDCHDIDLIANGMKFQQGRTDVAGNVVMQDDYFGDGRWWQRSPGRFGIWSQATTLQMAGKDNANESVFDQSAFAWIRDCSGCHVGGGPGEFDRDGELLYNETTGEFGYEVLGKTPAEVVLDGDYADFDYATSTVVPARWDLSGRSEPDCLFCHRREPPNLYWREASLGGATQIVDDGGNPVKGFAAAATAGQGWISNIDIVHEGFTPEATTLQIDYSVGVGDGSLVENLDGSMGIAMGQLTRTPLDQACWICHVQKESLDGMVWYDDTPDVHYRYINKLTDTDPNNDIPGDKSQACHYCHPGGLEHNIAKGNGFEFAWRNGLDWTNFRTCRNCHLPEDPPGTPNPLRHPDAPELVHEIHFPELVVGNMIDVLSCQACHIPYALNHAILYFDSTAGGMIWDTMCCAAMTFQYYSADPLDPTNPDKSRWYPALMWKTDVDGVDRLFPCIPWPNVHWADWDQNSTPGDLSDDLLTPVIEWRMYELIGSEPLPVVTDDDGDGRVEMNRPEEILAYITALKGNDSYGRQVAANPVLVKGDRVWYEDLEMPDGVHYFEHEGTGIPVKWWYYNWGLDHNVLPATEAWGTEGGAWACGHCHQFWNGGQPTKVMDRLQFWNGGQPTKVMDRLILVDPYGTDGQPVYKTVKELTGVNPQ